MTDKQLSKLRRPELLEILLEQGRELDKRQQELDAANQALANRELNLQEAGSIADAAFRLNDVLGAAQRAADLYSENVRRVLDRQQQESDKTLEDAQARADILLADADKRVRSQLEAAGEQAARILANARAEAERILAEAQADAQQERTSARLERDSILTEARRVAAAPPEGEQEPKKRRGLFGRRGDNA